MNRSGNQHYSEEDQGDDQHGSPSQANVSYDQRNSNSREEGSAHDQSYQASTRHNPNVEPAQLESIKDIVSKLSSTEAKINSLKADLHTRFTKIETNQKDVKDFSEILLDQIRKNPISRKPGLDQDIQQGVEAAIVESGATIHRLKKENGDLKETIKTKNRYIENIQENYRNLKKAFDEKVAENEKLKQALEQRDHELVQHKRKEDNEYKVNAMRENIRATRNEQGGYMQKREEQQHYGDGIRDDYDFWKTTNDNAPQDVDRDSRGKGKLDNLFQGQNKLFIQDKNAVGGINFDNLKLSSQQPR